MATPFDSLRAALANPGAGPFKLCGACRRVLPHADFTANHGTGDGLQGECKSCRADLRKHERATSETHQESAARRKAAMADGNATPADVARLRREAEGRPCPECGALMERGAIEIDHALALSLGGRHDVENLRAICHEDHKVKTRRDRAEAKRRGSENPCGLGEMGAPEA